MKRKLSEAAYGGGGGEAVRKYRSEEYRLEGTMAAGGRPPISISTPGSGSRSHKAETPARAVQSKAEKDFFFFLF